MTAALTWPQVLAWRMHRQLLDPVGKASVPDVVRRLCGVQAQVASSAELAVRVRRASSRPGEVARALGDGRLIKTWAMRGTLHLLDPGSPFSPGDRPQLKRQRVAPCGSAVPTPNAVVGVTT